MKCVRLPRILAIAASLLALQGCVQNVVIPVSLEGFVLTSSNRIIGFGTADASRAIISTTVTGLATNEKLLDIDYRTAEGRLYALSSLGHIYSIIGSIPTKLSTLHTASSTSVLSSSVHYTLDVDPVRDRLRVVGDDGTNLDVDMNSGLATAGTAIAAPALEGLGHTDKPDASAGRRTELYAISTASDTVAKLDPATGLTSAPAALGVNATSVLGYDINPADNKGYAMLTVAGVNGLYRIDETVTGATPAATRLSGTPAMLSGEHIVGLAMLAAKNPTVIALDNSAASALRQFAARTPDTLGSAVTVTGLGTGETLLGIDARASDGKLYGLGSLGNIYSIDDTGAASVVGPTLTLNSAHSYLMEMNPLVNTATAPYHQGLLHVIDTTSKEQFTVDIENNTINAPVTITPATVNLVGSAFGANYAGATLTSQYVADLTSASLAVLATGNGSVSPGLATGLSLGSAAGFDISGHFNENVLLAARAGSSGTFTLYRLSTSSAGANSLGVIGGSSGPTALADIAIRY